MAQMDLKWPQHFINYLGGTIPINPSKDIFELFRLNLDSYRDKLAPKLDLWKTKGISILDKITNRRNLILPKLYYKLTVLSTET